MFVATKRPSLLGQIVNSKQKKFNEIVNRSSIRSWAKGTTNGSDLRARTIPVTFSSFFRLFRELFSISLKTLQRKKRVGRLFEFRQKGSEQSNGAFTQANFVASSLPKMPHNAILTNTNCTHRGKLSGAIKIRIKPCVLSTSAHGLISSNGRLTTCMI